MEHKQFITLNPAVRGEHRKEKAVAFMLDPEDDKILVFRESSHLAWVPFDEFYAAKELFGPPRIAQAGPMGIIK